MGFGEYIGAGSNTTRLLLHLNGNSNDSSGNGNNGTDNAISYGKQYGKFNEGAYFNGSNSNITCQVSVDVNGFTIIIWKYIINANAYRNIISKCTNNFAHPFDVYVVQGSTNVNFYIGNGRDQGQGANITGSNCVIFNKWQCWMFTFNNATALATINVDGKFVTSGILNKTVADGTNPIKLGIRQDNFVKMYGYADELIVENRVWTLQEYQKYYTSALGRF